MVVEYENKTNTVQRLIMIICVPFVLLIAGVMISVFDPFGEEAYRLALSIFQGDLSRFGSFLGFLAVVVIVVVNPLTVIAALLYGALLRPSYVVRFDMDQRLIEADFHWPWRKPCHSQYRLDEISAVEQVDDDWRHNIVLHLPDRRMPITVMSFAQERTAALKFNQLREMGLPGK